jgi:hypothetical protein
MREMVTKADIRIKNLLVTVQSKPNSLPVTCNNFWMMPFALEETSLWGFVHIFRLLESLRLTTRTLFVHMVHSGRWRTSMNRQKMVKRIKILGKHNSHRTGCSNQHTINYKCWVLRVVRRCETLSRVNKLTREWEVSNDDVD